MRESVSSSSFPDRSDNGRWAARAPISASCCLAISIRVRQRKTRANVTTVQRTATLKGDRIQA